MEYSVLCTDKEWRNLYEHSGKQTWQKRRSRRKIRRLGKEGSHLVVILELSVTLCHV